VEIFKIQY